MVEPSSKQVPNGSFERINMLEYAPAITLNGIVAVLSLFDLTRQEITSMAHEYFQWLQPGGYLLICVLGAEDCDTTPDLYDADGCFATGVPFTFMNHKVFINIFTKAGWITLLEQAGFEISHKETEIFIPPASAICDNETHFFVIAQRSLGETRTQNV